MKVQIKSPADPYADVSIEPRFGPVFPEELQDEFQQRLNNGVNRGISLSSVSLLPDSIVVRILELKMSSSPQSILYARDRINLGYLLEITISGNSRNCALQYGESAYRKGDLL